MKLDKKELITLLNIKERTLKKYINNNTLKEKLIEQGYILKDTIKEGRKKYYIIEQVGEKGVYNNMCKYVYNTNRQDSFSRYFHMRTEYSKVNKPVGQKEIATIAGVSRNTISKWDNTLIDKNIIAKDGFFYFYIKADTKEVVQCSIEEYKSFWRNKALLKACDTLQSRYLRGEITLNELTVSSLALGGLVGVIENKYYFRTKKYKVHKDNKLYLDTEGIIKELYGYKSFNELT